MSDANIVAPSVEECNQMAQQLLDRICHKHTFIERHIINVEHSIDPHYHEHGYPIRMVLWAASETHYRREKAHDVKIDGNLLERLREEAGSQQWLTRGDVSVYREFKVMHGRDTLRFMFEVPLTQEWYPLYVRSAWN